MKDQIVVVGAGMAGLSAARHLAGAGHAVRVVDKGRSVGGRLATRRIGGATLDHGAQFFTSRGDDFAASVRQALAADVAYEWCRGFGPFGDGHPRYAARPGMNGLARHLATGLDVMVDAHVDAVSLRDGRWLARGTFEEMDATALVLTAPVPQSLALLDAGDVVLNSGLRARLDAVTYTPTLALLVVLDGPSAVPPPGGVQLTDGAFTFVADNQAKGISAEPAITLHATPELSVARFDECPEAVTAELLEAARPWLGEAGVVEAQLKRWRYAQPTTPTEEELEATVIDGVPLVFAGDAFAGAKVEGSFRSGVSAGRHVAAVLADRD